MFTDLVGSVAMQQRLGTAAYMRYVARHDQVIQECLAVVRGARVLNETGDGFLVCFDDPADAVNTALRLQSRLVDEVCEGEHVRVRIGLHLGVVTEMQERIRGEKRAVGMPVNLTARIMDLADGGQILMTRAVYEDARHHVREHPQAGAGRPAPVLKWCSHGFYEIKGDPEPVEVFEVGAEGRAPFAAPEGSAKARRVGGPGAPALPDAGSPAAAPVEVLTPEVIRGSDVFLNYAAIDDQPLVEGQPGWVSQLHRNLLVRVEQLSGRKVGIARLPEESVTPEIEAEVRGQFPRVKAMVSVVSPPFLHSDVCRREVEEFWRAAGESGGQWVADKARLLYVLKTAVSREEIPPRLADIFSPLLGFEFFERDSATGRVREFDEAFGPALKQRFFERVYDLAYDVAQILRATKHSGAQPAREGGGVTNGVRHRVYLATTTSDVQDERDRIKRELLERGHQVFPDGPLPMLSSDLEKVVCDCLVDCTIAVHLLGHHYGTTPEDSAESTPALQLRLTARQAQQQDLQRLVWMPGGGAAIDERQKDFIRRVQEDPFLQHRAEIIEGNLNLLKNDLIRCLAPPEEKAPAPQQSRAAGGAPKLYLICDAKDEAEVEALEDYLFDQGLEVCLPAFDGDDASAAALHQDNLLSCDAVLVYYGAAPRAWVDIKLRELLKAAGYGRATPIAVQGVYIAPPDDHRKERFRSHQASVIHQGREFAPSAELDGFLSQVRAACA
jgi:class 3 adenylate cyclase